MPKFSASAAASLQFSSVDTEAAKKNWSTVTKNRAGEEGRGKVGKNERPAAVAPVVKEETLKDAMK